jgi:hypothetical protein
MSSKKALSAGEEKNAIVVERAINNFFTSERGLIYKQINSIDNLELIIKYITYLNSKIQSNKITLTDVNVERKGKITEIRYDDSNSDIKYKYEKGGDKVYPVMLKTFIKDIYIYNDTNIFFLMPLKFRKANTPIFNQINIQKVEVDTLLPKSSEKSFAVPQSRIPMRYELMRTFSTSALKRKASSGKSSSSTLKPFSSYTPYEKSLKLRDSDYNIKFMTDVTKILNELKRNPLLDIKDYLKGPKELEMQKVKRITDDKQKQTKTNEINNYYKRIIRKVIEIQQSKGPSGKKQRTTLIGGDNSMKKIIRKVYTDNKYRKYIKYNKNTIIYLKD